MPPRNMRGLATNVAQTINNQAPNKGERGHTPWPGEPREMKPGERWDNTYDNAALVSVKTEWDKGWEFNHFQGKGRKPTKGKAPAHFITPVYELPTPEGGVARRNGERMLLCLDTTSLPKNQVPREAPAGTEGNRQMMQVEIGAGNIKGFLCSYFGLQDVPANDIINLLCQIENDFAAGNVQIPVSVKYEVVCKQLPARAGAAPRSVRNAAAYLTARLEAPAPVEGDIPAEGDDIQNPSDTYEDDQQQEGEENAEAQEGEAGDATEDQNAGDAQDDQEAGDESQDQDAGQEEQPEPEPEPEPKPTRKPAAKPAQKPAAKPTPKPQAKGGKTPARR